MNTVNGDLARRGFTLVELVVVVLLLGIIAAIATSKILGTADRAQEQAFIADLFAFVDAMMLYDSEHGDFSPDADSGALPDGLESYLHQRDWQRPTAIGGVWDIERDKSGVKFAVGVHFQPGTEEAASLDVLQNIDGAIDDGNLFSRKLRFIAKSRFY